MYLSTTVRTSSMMLCACASISSTSPSRTTVFKSLSLPLTRMINPPGLLGDSLAPRAINSASPNAPSGRSTTTRGGYAQSAGLR